MSPNVAPCTDVLREALYIRSLVETPGAGSHLVDESARVEPSDFYHEPHRQIAACIYEMADSRARPYRADVAIALNEPGLSCFERIMQSGETQPVAKLAIELKRLAKRRRAYEHTLKIAAAFAAGDDERAAQLATELRAEGQEARDCEYMQAAEAIEHARKHDKQGGPTHMRTGYPALDRAIGTLRPRTCTVIGGYEGTAKSSVMLGMAINLARRGVACGIVSLEDPPEVYGPRVLAHMSDVNPREFDGARGEWFDAQVNSGITIARELGLYFAFEEQQPLNKVLASMRHLVRKCGCKALFVDYLQCVRGRGDKRNDEVAYAASRIKGQAQRLGVALVLGSQLNNPEKGKEFKEPRNTSLKESGDIKDMAEAIILLWKSSDESDARTFGKVSKCKWSPDRPRFEVQRNPRTGCVEGLGHG